MVWYTYRMEGILTNIIEKNIAAFTAAESLETSLVNQKGFVSYYFVDGDPDWLKQLAEYRGIFTTRLKEVRIFTENPQERGAVDRIEKEYNQYVALKDMVIAHYKAGNRKKGAELHRRVRNRFFSILKLCEDYKQIHAQKIRQAEQQSHNQAVRLRVFAVLAMAINLLLALILTAILVRQILQPVSRILQTASKDRTLHEQNNEVTALTRSVEGLIQNVDQAQLELEKSRESLLQAEKMAMVGKLAAGMAHSIRNPFTSVKMRLFSLNRSLHLDDTQREDFDVITEEIRHIDTIVENFLEFSRPPKLVMQVISPSTIVENTLQLLEHRLASYNVHVNVAGKAYLPPVEADPEQLKEVLVNLIVNACESMENGGTISIDEKEDRSGDVPQAVIRLVDTGPGIPAAIQEKIFQPFFTTKEEGTGLGLSIASRIVDEHQGRLTMVSQEGHGTTFILSLPIKEM